MPISNNLNDRKNLITKLSNYPNIINIPNSVTILSDIIPAIICLIENNITGIYNMVNPGVITHDEIMKYYKKYVDNKKSWKIITLDEQTKLIKVPRCNNKLSCKKLQNTLKKLDYPEIPEVHESLIKIFKSYSSS